jgi:uncharacterized integral membrane protein
MSRPRVIALFVGLLLLLALALGALLPNRDPVWFRLFWSQPWAVALWLIMACCGIGGLVLGSGLIVPLWLGQRRQRQQCQAKLRAADDEVAALRRILARDAVSDSTVGLPPS